MIELNGVTIIAPGLTASQFDEAVQRAYDEGLTVQDAQKRWAAAIHNPKKGMNYLVSPETCRCMAGSKGHSCRPRAARRSSGSHAWPHPSWPGRPAPAVVH